jgi:hypothetical protein
MLAQREMFMTSRLMDFFSQKELTAQMGHGVYDWPLVAAKELIDIGIAPKIMVSLDDSGSTLTDNGPGIPSETVRGILEFTVPFVLDGESGLVEIEARAIQRWRVIALSSGERTLSAMMAEIGRKVNAGQSVRLLNIPATDFQHGAFECLHAFPTGQAFSEHLEVLMQRRQIYFSAQQWERLSEEATRLGISVSELIRRIIDSYFEKRG